MKEIRDILAAVSKLGEGEKAVLATVVDLKGSGYRLPGARMLIKANGDAIGTVSGGCLEADVMERAKRVLETGRAEVFTYDTTSHEDSVFSLNMGCRGVMRILMESISAGRECPFFHTLKLVYGPERRTTWVATVIDNGGLCEVPVGSRSFRDGYAQTDRFPSMIEDLETFARGDSSHETIKYEIDGSLVEFVFERISPPVHLFVLGAGADAVPLADAAYALGWQVKVCDHRPAFLTGERFPESQLVSLDREAHAEWDVDDLTAFVLMNHNYDRDKMLLSGALGSRAFYVGALGPRKRTEQILGELGNPFTEDELSRLRAPAGLDIGGDTPEAIAISIVAEIQCVLKKRLGGPLRERKASIYDRK